MGRVDRWEKLAGTTISVKGQCFRWEPSTYKMVASQFRLEVKMNKESRMKL